MPRIAVVTDSTADFPGVEPADLNVTVVPLTVHWGRDVLRDRVDLSTSEFYVRLRVDPNLPKTAAPPVGIFEEVYRQALATYDAVISIHIASRLSGTHNTATTAARTVDPDRIHVIDSTSTSVGLGWLVQCAAQMAHAEESVDAITHELGNMIPRLRLYFALETLDFLQRGGRIGRAQAFVGSLLNVKPILQLSAGEVHPVERVRTRVASIRRISALATSSGARERMAIVHGDCEPEARQIRDELARSQPELPIAIAEIGAVVATYTGPGIIGVGCLLAS